MRFAWLVFLFSLSFVYPQTERERITTENAQELSEVQSRTYEETIIRDLTFQPASGDLFIIRLNRFEGLAGDIVPLDENTLNEIPSDQFAKATAFTFSPDGSRFALGTGQGEIIVYNTSQWEQISTIHTSVDVVNDIAISPDNAYLGATFGVSEIVAEREYAFQLFDLVSGEEVASLPPNSADVYGRGMTFNESGEVVFFSTVDLASGTGQVYVGNTRTHELTETYSGCNATYGDLLFETKMQVLFCISEQGVELLDSTSATDAVVRNLVVINEGESITQVALNPDESLLAVGYFKSIRRSDGGPSVTNAGMIKIYDVETGEELIMLEVPKGAITSLAFSPDGTLLASGGTDGTVRLWGVVDG
ncbi:MAG: hypothetical protein HXY41_07955 [Chloroflexi bacterium]|nr:hypothetical protein [Chloroflexota bacterium]